MLSATFSTYTVIDFEHLRKPAFKPMVMTYFAFQKGKAQFKEFEPLPMVKQNHGYKIYMTVCKYLLPFRLHRRRQTMATNTTPMNTAVPETTELVSTILGEDTPILPFSVVKNNKDKVIEFGNRTVYTPTTFIIITCFIIIYG